MVPVACGSAPSMASPTACCACTGTRPSCPRRSRCSTATTSCGWSSAWPSSWNWMTAVSRRGRSPGGSMRRRTRAADRSTSSPATIPGPTRCAGPMRCTRNAATAPAWSISPNCCCVRTNCCATPRRCWATTAPVSATCWSTSSRTPMRSSTPSCGCWPATVAGCSWSATTTRPSTAGAGPGWRTCSSSCAISPAPGPSAWSRTTAPAPTSSTPPTR